MVVYNAGTDVLVGDSLGQLDITSDVRRIQDTIHMHLSNIKLLIKPGSQ